MKHFSSVIYFLAAAAIVIMIGGLAGWYVFVNRQIGETRTNDAARGFGNIPAFGSGGSGTSDSFSTASSEIASGGATTTASNEKEAPRLWHVHTKPTAGFGFRATGTILMYAESATGNVFQAAPETSAIARMTSTLYPKIHEALLNDEGAFLRASEGDVITTFAGLFATTTATSTSGRVDETPALKGLSLAPNILDMALAPKRTIVYLVADSSGAAIMQSDWRGGSQKKLYTSPLLDWRVSVLADGTITLTQKTTDRIPGYAYTLSASGTLTPLETDIPGLTVLPRVGGARLFGSSDGTLALFARISADGAPSPLPIRTTADKCVWAPGIALIAYCAVPQNIPGAQYLSDRDQGTTHSTDAWYRINASNGTAEPFYSPNPGLALDVLEPQIDPSGSYIAFRNAADQSLWMLRIAQ